MNGRRVHLALELGAGFVAGFIAIQVLFLLPASADPSLTWSQANCNGIGFFISTWKRAEAQSYAAQDNLEGYEWGGGCYRLNDIDDTPGAPDSGGEGADCSGFTFKTWALKPIFGTGGRRYWEHEKEVHGPYNTASLIAPCATCPFKPLVDKSYPSTQYMDAFVYHDFFLNVGHTGMIYLEGSAGFDYMVEAKSDDLGTRIAYTDYRQQSAYQGIRRKGWTPDCFPQCLLTRAQPASKEP